VSTAYLDAADPSSLEEEAGQVETARRALELVERWVRPGPLLDIGCWTGSFLEAASARGWTAMGIEPSTWAAGRAAQRGLDVRQGEFDEIELPPARWRLVVLGDVLEHLADPGAALDRVAGLLEEGGGLYLTVPDAGSACARMMGRRWWSVLPMHLQYFTRQSMTRLLSERGFLVRHVGSHPKVFSAGYYAARLGGYHPTAARVAVSLTDRVGWSDRLVSPDFRDRMAILATR
jgi:SAM-dependent methyltransferase